MPMLPKLWLVVCKARIQNRQIIFSNLSQALWSYPFWKSSKTVLMFDWTRTLYSQVKGEEIENDSIFKLQKKTLEKLGCIYCWTDAIKNNLQSIYNLDNSKLHKLEPPILHFDNGITPSKVPSKPRLLFVGGDLKRKGGDILLEYYKSKLEEKYELTILSSDENANIPSVNYFSNVTYGTEEHRKIFSESDILILPTYMDAFGQVIAEAASHGLAVVTTKFALGAPEIVVDKFNGRILDSPQTALEYLDEISRSHDKIYKMKVNSVLYMNKNYTFQKLKQSYNSIIDKV